jgi:hypothetical protein
LGATHPRRQRRDGTSGSKDKRDNVRTVAIICLYSSAPVSLLSMDNLHTNHKIKNNKEAALGGFRERKSQDKERWKLCRPVAAPYIFFFKKKRTIYGPNGP